MKKLASLILLLGCLNLFAQPYAGWPQIVTPVATPFSAWWTLNSTDGVTAIANLGQSGTNAIVYAVTNNSGVLALVTNIAQSNGGGGSSIVYANTNLSNLSAAGYTLIGSYAGGANTNLSNISGAATNLINLQVTNLAVANLNGNGTNTTLISGQNWTTTNLSVIGTTWLNNSNLTIFYDNPSFSTNGLIPQMTSTNTPSGFVFSTGVASLSSTNYQAFNPSYSAQTYVGWLTGIVASNSVFIAYDFGTNVTANLSQGVADGNGVSNVGAITNIMSYSTNGTLWIPYSTNTAQTAWARSGVSCNSPFSPVTARYFRWDFYVGVTNTYYFNVYALQLYNVKQVSPPVNNISSSTTISIACANGGVAINTNSAGGNALEVFGNENVDGNLSVNGLPFVQQPPNPALAQTLFMTNFVSPYNGIYFQYYGGAWVITNYTKGFIPVIFYNNGTYFFFTNFPPSIASSYTNTSLTGYYVSAGSSPFTNQPLVSVLSGPINATVGAGPSGGITVLTNGQIYTVDINTNLVITTNNIASALPANVVTNQYDTTTSPLLLDSEAMGNRPLSGQLQAAMQKPWNFAIAQSHGPYFEGETNIVAWITNMRTNNCLNVVSNQNAQMGIYLEILWDAPRVSKTNALYIARNFSTFAWNTNYFPHGIPWIADYCHTNGFKLGVHLYFVTNLLAATTADMYICTAPGGDVRTYTNGVGQFPTNSYSQYCVLVTPDTAAHDISEMFAWGVDAVCFSGAGSSIGQAQYDQMNAVVGNACMNVLVPVSSQINAGIPYPGYANVNTNAYILYLTGYTPVQSLAWAGKVMAYLTYETPMQNQHYAVGYQNLPAVSGTYYDNAGQGDGDIGLRTIARDFPTSKKAPGAYVVFQSVDYTYQFSALALVHGIFIFPWFGEYGAAIGSTGSWVNNSNVLNNASWLAIQNDPDQNMPGLVNDYGTNIGSVWMERLAGGNFAVGMFNDSASPTNESINWSQLGLNSNTVCHLFQIVNNGVTNPQNDLGLYSNSCAFTIPATSGYLYTVKPISFAEYLPIYHVQTNAASPTFATTVIAGGAVGVNISTSGTWFPAIGVSSSGGGNSSQSGIPLAAGTYSNLTINCTYPSIPVGTNLTCNVYAGGSAPSGFPGAVVVGPFSPATGLFFNSGTNVFTLASPASIQVGLVSSSNTIYSVYGYWTLQQVK